MCLSDESSDFCGDVLSLFAFTVGHRESLLLSKNLVADNWLIFGIDAFM